ncbi:MAG: MlaD family protein [Rhodospirillaceae bacterium]|nr:MlaD family protein [Rhodospirillaceae bacterium]
MAKIEQRETLVGVVALVVAVAALTLTALANRVSQQSSDAAARYVAEFARADGLHQGAPVRLAGMTIGSVGEVALDDRYRAVMTLVLTQDVPLPEDTAAIIETDGVFGSKYIELQPGGSETMLKPGARIGYTQDSVIIEELISKIVAQAKAAAKKDAPQPAP